MEIIFVEDDKMKKLALFVALATIGICNANAQGSVTLYGRIAAGLDYVTNVATPDGQSKHNFRFGSNQYGYSWFGLKGDEDLGGGVHAVFKLESLFTSGNGQLAPDTIFTRCVCRPCPRKIRKYLVRPRHEPDRRNRLVH
jgi:predicted porin